MYVTIDLGGTLTRVAASKDLATLDKTEKFLTVHDLNIQKKLVSAAIRTVVGDEKINKIILGVPGTLDRENTKFVNLPNYSALNNQSYDVLLEEDLKTIDIIVENDAVLAVLGESKLGAGKKFTRVAYLTLSTGVGGALAIKEDGDYVAYPKEPGHKYILSNGKSLEDTCSGEDFEKNYGIPPGDCNDLKIWEEYCALLAEGIDKIILEWSPDVIILGGRVSKKFNLFIPILKKQLLSKNIPEFKRAKLRDDSGLYGGLVYLNKAFAVSQ